jgi:hydrogenase nickel incorporation protein HypA/HybF
MHELSIVMSIVDIAEQQVRQAGARRVDSIELEIGDLAGIEPAALDFAWEAAVRDTVLATARREINHIPGRARCAECGQTYRLEHHYDPCPHCGNMLHQLLSGRELRVKALTVS